MLSGLFSLFSVATFVSLTTFVGVNSAPGFVEMSAYLVIPMLFLLLPVMAVTLIASPVALITARQFFGDPSSPKGSTARAALTASYGWASFLLILFLDGQRGVLITWLAVLPASLLAFYTVRRVGLHDA